MLELQIVDEAIIIGNFVAPLTVAVMISLLIYFILRRTTNSLRIQFQQTVYDLNNLKQQINSDLDNLKRDLPRFDDIKDMKERVLQMEDSQKNFTQSLKSDLDYFKRSYSEEIDKIRNDIVKVAETKSIEVAKNHVETISVSKEEFDRLRDKIERLLGAEELVEKLDLLGSIFDTKNIKTLVWQCKLIRLTERGLAPEVEEDTMLQAGIPLTTAQTFLKKLEEREIIMPKMVRSYFLLPEYTWLLSYIENPDRLQQIIQGYIKKEEEYQKYIRENIDKVEEGMIVISEQFEVESGRIDILCRDKNGSDVGLELKYPAASVDVIGQMLRYREDYIRRTANHNVRFILVAPKISGKLRDFLSYNKLEYKEILF